MLYKTKFTANMFIGLGWFTLASPFIFAILPDALIFIENDLTNYESIVSGMISVILGHTIYPDG